MVPLESHPDFVVDRLLLTEERFRDTQRSCHGCTMVLWAVVERDGELVPHGIPKRAAVHREGFAICTADACLSYKARGIKARKIFCLECLRLRERGGGSKPFDECFRPRVGGGYEQLLGTCLHCELGHGVQCKLRESDDTTCPSAVWKRDHPKKARNAEKRKDPDTQELTPVPCDWRRCASWRDGFLSDLVNLPNPQDYLFFYPGAAPRDPVYHTLRRTAPLRRHEWAFLWPLPELPPLDSIFFVLSHQPSKLACDRPPPHAGVLSYRVRPPFWSGVFFFARAGWLYGHYERVADAGPEFAPLERKQRVAEDKVSLFVGLS